MKNSYLNSYLYCDICHSKLDCDFDQALYGTPYGTRWPDLAIEARKFAENQGWKTKLTSEKDFCPKCQEAQCV